LRPVWEIVQEAPPPNNQSKNGLEVWVNGKNTCFASAKPYFKTSVPQKKKKKKKSQILSIGAPPASGFCIVLTTLPHFTIILFATAFF
jgi:hypothetical protein